MLGLQASLAGQAKRGTFAMPLMQVILAAAVYISKVCMYLCTEYHTSSIYFSTSAHTLQRVLPRDVAFVVRMSYLPAYLPCHAGRES